MRTGAGIDIQRNLYCQFLTLRFRNISENMLVITVLSVEAVTMQGKACQGLRLSDKRCLHLEQANQSQDSADNVFEYATCFRLHCQCFRWVI